MRKTKVEFADRLLKQFLSDAYLSKPEIESGKVLIKLGNGTFHFTEQEWNLKPFNAADFQTYQLPFNYDAEPKCPDGFNKIPYTEKKFGRNISDLRTSGDKNRKRLDGASFLGTDGIFYIPNPIQPSKIAVYENTDAFKISVHISQSTLTKNKLKDIF